jgi:hypothetical protein
VWLTIASAIVLVAGVVTFLIAYNVGGIRNTAHVSNPQPRNEKPQVYTKPKTVPMSRAAANVAIRFIDTAPARKNLAESYRLVAPELRQGISFAEWKKGSIPIAYFPVWAKGAGYSPYQVAWSYENELMLKILLTPKKGLGLKSQQFWIGIKRANAHSPWKVFYFQPYWYPPRLSEQD